MPAETLLGKRCDTCDGDIRCVHITFLVYGRPKEDYCSVMCLIDAVEKRREVKYVGKQITWRKGDGV